MLVYGQTIYKTMKNSISRKPYLTALIASGLLLFFEIAFLARTVLSKNTVALLAEPSGFSATMQIIQLASVVITFLGFAAGFVWYVVKGKSSEQQAATIKQLETSNADLRAQVADLRLQKAEWMAEKKELENDNEDLRKKNLRLQRSND